MVSKTLDFLKIISTEKLTIKTGRELVNTEMIWGGMDTGMACLAMIKMVVSIRLLWTSTANFDWIEILLSLSTASNDLKGDIREFCDNVKKQVFDERSKDLTNGIPISAGISIAFV
jgi:hypothetical protein